MAYSLPHLDYPYDALEPFIDEETMKLHHLGHHKNYVDKFNEVLEKTPQVKDAPLEELLSSIQNIPVDAQKSIRNDGGGHYNHSVFWKILSPEKQEPSHALVTALETYFDSYEMFCEKFSDAALKQFGSGYAWLTLSSNGKLMVESTSNQDTPLELGRYPLLLIDVWEHAYYLKYHHKRAEFIQAFWNVVNWVEVENRYNTYRSQQKSQSPPPEEAIL